MGLSLVPAPAAGRKKEVIHAEAAGPSLRRASLLSAVSRALDLSTGQPVGHSVRSCIIGMRIAGELELPLETRNDLYYALLLKDCGCSGSASKVFHTLVSDDLKAKRDAKTADWNRLSREALEYALDHVAVGKSFLERSRALCKLALTQKAHSHAVAKIRGERGYRLARLMGLSEAASAAILGLDEHWDGRGEPLGLCRTEIPILSRIMLLAQTLEVFFAARGASAAFSVARERIWTWFDPDLVRAALSCRSLFAGIAGEGAFSLVLEFDAQCQKMGADSDAFDSICLASSQIVDAKSPFTLDRAKGVANTAAAIARKLGLPPGRIRFLRRAALLQDLGMLGVSNAILEKPGKLDEAEWEIMRAHPFRTWQILRSVPGLEELGEAAGSHHEKLDGTGYFRGLSAEQLSTESRILAVADIFEALAAKRPYRDGLPIERVFEILRNGVPHAIDGDCVAALEESYLGPDRAFADLCNLDLQLSRR